MRMSVIVTTYNRPLALGRVLHALSEQRLAPTEILVADDGSTEPTRQEVERWRARSAVPIRHVWQADDGFRAAAVRNLAAAHAVGDWFVFLDGDCVPQVRFTERIAALAVAGRVLAGDRILLSATLTDEIETAQSALHQWPAQRWLSERLRGRINRLAPLAHWPLLAGRAARERDWRHLRSANMALARADFERVNGFEEAFVGWGFEDSELAVRLINEGILIRSARMAAGVFHLWHPESTRQAIGDNQARLDQALASGKRRADLGLDRLRP
jgi:glycosyltransferase involved in cell wall biosynthesis